MSGRVSLVRGGAHLLLTPVSKPDILYSLRFSIVMLKIMEKSPNLLGKKIVLILTMSSQVPHTALT